jgi:hypothetical protein
MKRTFASAVLSVLALAVCIGASAGQSRAADEAGQSKASDVAGTGYIAPKAEVLGVLNNKAGSNVNSPMFNYGAEAGFNVTNDVSVGVDVLGTSLSQHTHNPVALNNAAATNTATLGVPVGTAPNRWNTVSGIGGDGVLNWRFWNTDGFGLYTGLNAGLTGFDHVTPVNSGTSLLFEEGAKLGFTARLTDALDLDTAAKFNHYGEFSDKGLNGLGGSFDLKYHF